MTTTTISRPGTYPDLDSATYHSDPTPDGSISASMAKSVMSTDMTPRDWDTAHEAAYNRDEAHYQTELAEDYERGEREMAAWETNYHPYRDPNWGQF